MKKSSQLNLEFEHQYSITRLFLRIPTYDSSVKSFKHPYKR